ncbi:hypothetical protein [Duganella levis]|uniref:Uncharacterized protein n=1 Tax=Duganella levis TaxID=2692169 RepID=A0ABW9VU52_9BURK|nr:hypothetical protein [Duganella levis]MYN25153.1 hypothetical protein [Duganella levis]
MKKFAPYQNESDVLNIGDLCIENRLDRISIHGDIDLTADQAGLADARALQQLLAAAVARLEAQQLPDKLPPPVTSIVANPFE